MRDLVSTAAMVGTAVLVTMLVANFLAARAAMPTRSAEFYQPQPLTSSAVPR